MKVLLIILLISIIAIVVLSLIIKNKNKKLKIQKNTVDVLIENGKSKDNFITKLKEENQIERKHNQELQKKLENISTMSIDDVMRELQND